MTHQRNSQRGIAVGVAALGAGIALSGCSLFHPNSQGPKLTDQQVCEAHYEHDPVMRDQCHLSPEVRRAGTVDASPQQLPIKTEGPGDRH